MLQEFFNLLDLPGSSVRDLVGGENPFDQWASPLSGEHRLSGSQLVSRYTGASPDSWGSTLAGFGAEMVLDPTNLVGGLGLLKKALAARRANALGKVTSVVDDIPAGRYGYVNPRALPAEAELITDPIRLSPLREDFGQRRIPQMESDYETFWHGTGREWPPEPDFPLGRPRADRLLTGTGGAREGPGLYAAQNYNIGEHYFDMLSKSGRPIHIGPPQERDSVLQTWAKRTLSRADLEDPRLYYADIPKEGGWILRAPDPYEGVHARGVWDAAERLHMDMSAEELQRLTALKDIAIRRTASLNQELGLRGNPEFTTNDYFNYITSEADDLTDPGVFGLLSEVDDLAKSLIEFNDIMYDVEGNRPVKLPSAIRDRLQKLREADQAESAASRTARTGGLYKLAVPKKKLDKFMYGDKPVAEAVAHIPEAANYPIAVNDTAHGYFPEAMTGSRSVYHGEYHLDIPRAIAENFGIKDPTGADAQRILTETFGISGNKYLDAVSRTSTDSPTYNHVIWDPEILENIRVRSVTRIGPGGKKVTVKEPFNRMLQGSRPRPVVMEPNLVNTLGPTTRSSWSPGTERLLNRKAAATLAVYNMAARQGGYTVE